MPIQKCESDGKPGFRWGTSGTCYTYTTGDDASRAAARKKATKQALAQNEGKMPEHHFSQLETVTLKGVEIIPADVKGFGTQDADPEGELFDVERLEKIAEASNAAADLKAPLKIGHSKEQQLLRNSGLASDEEPAAGWLGNFRVKGDKLLADVKDVPKKLAQLAETAFKTRSAEIGSWVDQTTDTPYPEVVRGLALLGTTVPAFQTLDEIVATYSARDDSAGLTAALIETDEALDDPDVDMTATFAASTAIVWDSNKGAQDVMEDLRRALNPEQSGAMVPSRYWVRDVMVTEGGGRALVDDYEQGDSSTCWVVPFAFDGDGDPVPADQATWTLAQQAWVAASSDAAGASVAAAPSTLAGTAPPDNNFAARAFAAAENLAAEISRDTTIVADGDQTPKPGEEQETKLELSADEQSGIKRLLAMFGISKDEGDGEDGKKGELKVKPEAVAAFAKAAGVEGETDLAKIIAKVEADAKKPDEPEIPAGMVLFAADEQKRLEEMAQAGVEAKKQLDDFRKLTFLKSFAQQGRIDPGEFTEYGDLYDKVGEESAKKIMEKLPVNPERVATFGASERDELVERLLADRGKSEIDEEHYMAFCRASGIPYDRVIVAQSGGDE